MAHLTGRLALFLLLLWGSAITAAEDEAIAELQRHAKQGDVGAQTEICTKYMDGEIGAADAVKWCRNAAEQGNANAQFTLGTMFYLGQGAPQDDVEAVKWYRRAAEQSHPRAQATLGAMHIAGGRGVSQDYTEALKWLRRAAE